MDIFSRIGSLLGSFISVDMSFIALRHMSVARILVDIDVRDGLLVEMDIEVDGVHFNQNIDYSSLPFHCNKCHSFENLAKDCPMPFKGKY